MCVFSYGKEDSFLMIRTRIRFLPSLNQALLLGNRGTAVHQIRNQCRIPPTKNHLQVKPLMIPEPLFSRREFRSETTESSGRVSHSNESRKNRRCSSPPLSLSTLLPRISLQEKIWKFFSRKLGDRDWRWRRRERERERNEEGNGLTALIQLARI